MARVIILDSFPLSTMGKRTSNPPTLTDQCREWVIACIAAGNRVHVPAIVYYETLRELERMNAVAQIVRLKAFCFSDPGDPNRFLPLTTVDLEVAAVLWARSRNAGTPTSSSDSLDGDVILAAQALSLNRPASDYVVATTNVGHLSQFVSAEYWTNITP